MGYEELVSEARKLLQAAIAARYQGDLHANKVRVQAYADGYTRALLDAGLMERSELLELVAQARTGIEGQPLRERLAAAG